jgi:hypothetical protein
MGQLNRLLERYEHLGKRYIVGVDLGQAHDPTAIAVLEQHNSSPNAGNVDEALKIDKRFELRHLERLPLGTPYPAQVSYVAELLTREPLNSDRTSLVVDSTGVGRAVFDLFRRGGLKPRGITITGGQDDSYADGFYRVAKVQLVSTLQAALHSSELKIAAGLKDAKTLANELRDFRATFTSAGNVIFSAREGAHDDLVLATAIALWWGRGNGREASSERINIGALRVRF